MTEKYYIVMEVGWDYNDQNYFVPHYGGYAGPLAVFTDEEKANLCCAEKNLEYIQKTFQPAKNEDPTYWRKTQLSEYCSEGDGIESVLSDEGIQFLRDLGQNITEEDQYNWTIEHLTEEQTRMIVGCLVNPFYEVVEVIQ